MVTPPIPTNEKERLQVLQNFDLLNQFEAGEFQDYARIASLVCHTPISLVSLVDQQRQYFLARLGLNASETPRDISFCAHAINQPHEVLKVNDATKDKRFHDNPLVLNDPNIRFYAGVPLVTSEGYALGTLCIIDTKPRHLDEQQEMVLRSLSKQLINAFEMRRLLKIRQEALAHCQQTLDSMKEAHEQDCASRLNTIKNIAIELEQVANISGLTPGITKRLQEIRAKLQEQ